MKQLLSVLLSISLLAGCTDAIEESYHPAASNILRAPAYPLITIDPYTSAWSFSNELYGDPVRHWTGKEHPLIGCLRVDGSVYRFMGKEKLPSDSTASSGSRFKDFFKKTAKQLSATVMPTQTFYTFECGPVELDVIFTAPFLMDDLYTFTSPFNYVTFQARSKDGEVHEVQLYVEATPQWAVDSKDQPVTFDKITKGGLTFLQTGTQEQAILRKSGDDVRIDWGYFYLVGKETLGATFKIGNQNAVKREFVTTGKLTPESGKLSARMGTDMTALAYTHDFGRVGKGDRRAFLLLGYDDLYSVQYFGTKLLPFWKRGGKISVFHAFSDGYELYDDVMDRCGLFDKKLMSEAADIGGQSYAELCALAYRQAVAAHKLVTDESGNLLFLSKENFSNGSIGTVDVTYPSAPLFLIYNPELLKGMMNPIFFYSESGKWQKPFPAHDLGTYPLANGQTYPEDMPVEEAGNMLILTMALAAVEENADYALKHWEVLSVWADYLLKNGLDPENQLCTDDFAGHLAHNANLSAKAILGLASYGKLAELLGKKEEADTYLSVARGMAAQWGVLAGDGDHSRLTFDQPGTWSQKYNLVWDQLLGLHIFPEEVVQKEIPFYLRKQNRYGLPLDSRADYTKSDWVLWTACLASDEKNFEALIQPIWSYANETPSRVPLSDWHDTATGLQKGMQARSVVGGYYMRMLQSVLEKKK